jgi:glycosyltransferase involved in cell wall biosynthesis
MHWNDRNTDQIRVVHLIPYLSFYGGTARKYFSWLKSSIYKNHLFLYYEAQRDIERVSDEFRKCGAQIIVLKDNNLISQIYSIIKILSKNTQIILIGHHFRGAVLTSTIKLLKGYTVVTPLHGPADLFSPVKRSIYKVILKISDKVIYNSNYTSKSFRNIGNSEIIYNGLVYDDIPIKKAFEIKMPIKLCTIGTLVKWKNQQLLIEMMTQLSDQFVLTIIGEGKERDNLQMLAKNLNVEDRVHLPGKMQDAHKLIVGNDLYLHPSKNESFGMVVLEALFARVPVVVADCCATAEIIAWGKYGWLAPPNNSKAWADVVTEIIRNHELAWKKAKEGRTWAVKEFSDKAFSHKMDDMVRNIGLKKPILN